MHFFDFSGFFFQKNGLQELGLKVHDDFLKLDMVGPYIELWTVLLPYFSRRCQKEQKFKQRCWSSTSSSFATSG